MFIVKNSQSEREPLGAMVTRHNLEYFESGIYQKWISVVLAYYGDKEVAPSDDLRPIAFSELPLAAVVRREFHNRYPGVHSYHLMKLDPVSEKRVYHGSMGTEPTIVSFATQAGRVTEIKDRPLTSLPYTSDDVATVVRNAHELETAGYPFYGAFMSDRHLDFSTGLYRPIYKR